MPVLAFGIGAFNGRDVLADLFGAWTSLCT